MKLNRVLIVIGLVLLVGVMTAFSPYPMPDESEEIVIPELVQEPQTMYLRFGGLGNQDIESWRGAPVRVIIETAEGQVVMTGRVHFAYESRDGSYQYITSRR